jgi:predicted RNA binding protein YcfA (HicA-like mRNA interferase family)
MKTGPLTVDELLLQVMGKEKGFALTSIKAREMRRFLERHGYEVQSGQHRHLKFKHQTLGDVMLPLRPNQNLSHPTVKQIAHAMGIEPAELLTQVR